ncbi:hypothetical protein HYS47_04625 [Candidatus Woesearchaeota archaeon]|nr:hypothetical protein [Candidatus Woesearchaeota archaeon]
MSRSYLYYIVGVILLLGTITLLGGCTAPWQLMYCEADNDCPSHLLCRENRCVAYYNLPSETIISDTNLQDAAVEPQVVVEETPTIVIPPNTCTIDNPFLSCSIEAFSNPKRLPLLVFKISNDRLSETLIVSDLVFYTSKLGGDQMLCRASRAQGKKVESRATLTTDVEACSLEPYEGGVLQGWFELDVTKGYYASGQAPIATNFGSGRIPGTFSVYVNATVETKEAEQKETLPVATS